MPHPPSTSPVADERRTAPRASARSYCRTRSERRPPSGTPSCRSSAGSLDAWFTPRFVDRRRFLELQLAVPAEDYARGLEAIGAFDIRDDLAQIAAPTLVIAGAEDPATTVGDAEFLAEHIPGARLTVIPGAAHLANVERPERFNAELVRHLAGAE